MTDTSPLKHLLLPTDLLQEDDMVCLNRRHSKVAYGFYISILQKIARSKDAKIEQDSFFELSEYFGVSDPKEILSFLVNKQRLSIVDNNMLTNENILKDQIKCAKKQARWRREKGYNNSSMDSGEYSGTESNTESDHDSGVCSEQRTKNKEIGNKKFKYKKKEEENRKDKLLFGEYVYLTELEHKTFVDKFGEEFIQVAIDKLNGWIGSNPLPKRITNGKNAAATFRSWVLNSVAEQQSKAQNGFYPQKSRQDQMFDVLKELREEAQNET